MALIHETYLRLMDLQNVGWQNRAHFFAIAARLMRQIFIDHTHKHRASKHGGSDVKAAFEDAARASRARHADLVALGRTLKRLSAIDAKQGQIVELRYFGGLSVVETAEALGIPSRTVKRDRTVAKAWLRQQIGET